MKTVYAIATAAVLTGSASAFSLDFSAFASGAELDPDIVVNVPGYGDVRFTEAPNNDPGAPATDLEITAAHVPFKGIGFENGEQLVVSFEGSTPVEIDFIFAGVGSGESFDVNQTEIPDDGTRLISFKGSPGAALVGVGFSTVPEPSSTLLVALGALGFAARRRR